MKRGAPVTDINENNLVITKPKKAAARLEAAVVALDRGNAQAGVTRTARSLLRLNQRNGTDCPGCAWPESQGHRKTAEFCENGAKAVAEESTLRTVTPEFWAEHSIAELATKTEYWLGNQGRITHPVVIRPATRTTHRSPGTMPSSSSASRFGRPRRGAPFSTLRAARPTSRRSCTSSSPAPSAPTTVRTARICAMSPLARR